MAQKVFGPAPDWEQLSRSEVEGWISSEMSQIAPKAPASNSRLINVEYLSFREDTVVVAIFSSRAFLGKKASGQRASYVVICFDHFFYSANMKRVSVTVPDAATASDHNPVLTVFEVD